MKAKSKPLAKPARAGPLEGSDREGCENQGLTTMEEKRARKKLSGDEEHQEQKERNGL